MTFAKYLQYAPPPGMQKKCVTAYQTKSDYQERGLGNLVELPASISIYKSAGISVSEIFDWIVQK